MPLHIITPRTAQLSGERRQDFIRAELLSDIFAATAAARPGNLAAIHGDVRLTYGEMEARANRVANALIARGLGRGSFVGLWMARGLDLQIALLGILKAGAAYIPFDADAPADRVATCLADCAAGAIILDGSVAGPDLSLPAPKLVFERLAAESDDETAPDLAVFGVTSDEPAYAIYTSGSTGRPKAVVISHRNICHYLRAAGSIFGLTAEDVMFQGASVAFDLSLEEIFLPYMAGATLWIAGRETLNDLDRLGETLDAAGITVMDTVPTLLALLPRDVPSLRLIILGGEACPPAIAERWHRPGRRLFNTYGPTETTVVATIAELAPGETITIGRPVANTTCYVVDEALAPVVGGQEGELLIGGPGVAAGYLGRPELTAEKFIANPFDPNGIDPVLYRSGDAVSIDGAGRLLFHGRIDDQVKIRGFRVELGEIEARLVAQPAIAQAAVALRGDGGVDRLVAFVVPSAGAAAPDVAALRAALGRDMPAYMVPGHFETVDTLPRLTSGKVDRKTLKTMPLSMAPERPEDEPADEVEAALLSAAKRVFPGQSVPLGDDFFLDLGGHSLLAARFVSAVRETPDLANLTIQDVYAVRTLRAMAERLRGRAAEQAAPAADLGFTPPPLMRRALCGLAQAVTLPFILGLATLPWLGVFAGYLLLSADKIGTIGQMAALFGIYSAINIATVIVAVAGKWLILGRTRPGRYPLWGVYYFRWWLTQRLLAQVHTKWVQDTPVMRAYLRLLGARIGHDSVIGDVESGAFDLVEIGANATVAGRVHLSNVEVVGDEMIVGRVVIGNAATVGSSSVVGCDSRIGDGAELGDLSSLANAAHIGDGELWQGSPARAAGMVQDLPEAPPRPGRGRRALMAVLYTLALVVLPPVSLLPIFPAFALFDRVADLVAGLPGNDLTWLPLMAWPTAMALIALTVLLIAAVRWVVLPRVESGVYSIHGWFYFRKWLVGLCTELTLETLSSLYATVYMRVWYRLMGAKIGKGSEISTNLAGRYDLIEIGEKCFIADDVVLGEETIRNGWMTLEPVRTGARVFVGNHAVVPPGTDIPSGSLIGVKSMTPSTAEMTGGGTWFGSPPIKLPVRQTFGDMAAAWTYEPPQWRRVFRAVFEAFTVSFPSMLSIVFGIIAIGLLTPAIMAGQYGLLFVEFLAASVAVSVALALVWVAIKWMMMGVYRPVMKPMWSWWALRTEAVAVMYSGMAGRALLEFLRGTPFLPWALRLAGVHIGRGVFMDATDITEFDCVTIGDFAAINATVTLQTHLYEDRIMKVGRVSVGRGVSVGADATVLYDTKVGDYARIGPLTIVMKGEHIPAHSAWHGAPAQINREDMVGRETVATVRERPVPVLVDVAVDAVPVYETPLRRVG